MANSYKIRGVHQRYAPPKNFWQPLSHSQPLQQHTATKTQISSCLHIHKISKNHSNEIRNCFTSPYLYNRHTLTPSCFPFIPKWVYENRKEIFFLSKVIFIEWYCCDRGSEEIRKKEGKIFGNCRYYISHRFPLEYLQNTQ